MVKKPWTSLEERELLEMLADGSTLVEAARVLGRTTGSCQCKLHRMGEVVGRTGRVKDVSANLLVADLLDMGHPVIGVARVLKVSEPTVRKKVRWLLETGVLVRTGGATCRCRYRVSPGWKRSSTRAGLLLDADAALAEVAKIGRITARPPTSAVRAPT